MSVGPPPPDPPEERRHLQPLPPVALAVPTVVGLVLGWLLRPAAERIWSTAPTVGWLPVLVLFFAGAIMGWTAWATWQRIQARREYVEPQHMVNRLVLARACAVAGFLVAGGYLGYAVSWVGIAAELGGQRIVRSLLAALGSVIWAVTSLWLERACRQPTEPLDP